MAIPVGTKFIGIRPGVDLSERKSAFINDLTEAYEVGDFTGTFTGTTDDITEGVTNLFVTQSEKNLWNNGPHTVGTSGQIPFVNGAGDDLSYSSNLTWNDGAKKMTFGGYEIAYETNKLNFYHDGNNFFRISNYGAIDGQLLVAQYSAGITAASRPLYSFIEQTQSGIYLHYTAGTRTTLGLSANTYAALAVQNDNSVPKVAVGEIVNGISTINSIPATFTVYGSGSTSATTNFLLQNASGTDLLKVTDDGNVGIGTTSPLSKLTVYGALSSSSSQMSIINSEGGQAVFRAGIAGVANSGLSFLTANVDGTNQNLRMVINGSGRVGIGTASPTAKLGVKGSGSTSATTNLLLQNASGTDLLKVRDDGAIYATQNSIFAQGGVLPLIVGDGSGATYIRMSADVSSTAGIQFGDANDLDAGRIYYNNSNNYMQFYTSGGAALTIGTNRNVGIVTTNPQKKLDVIGTIRSQMTPPGAGNGDVYGFNIHTYITDNNRLGIGLHDDGDAFIALMSNTGIRSRIDTNGDSYLMGGNVGIGTTTPNASSILDLTSTTKGFLPPRMTTLEKNAIATPATGLLVYDTDEGVYNYFDGVSWTTMGLSLWQESGTNIYYDAGSVGVNTGGVNDAKFHVNGDGDNDSTVSFVVKSSLGNERFKVQDGGRFVHSSSSGSFIGYDDSIGNYKLNIKGTSGHGSYIWANGSNSLSIGNNGDIFIGRQNGTSGPLSFSSVIFDNVWGRLIIGDTDTTRNGNLRVRSGSNSTETINSVFTDNSENELMKILATGVVTVGYQGTTSSTSTLTTYANTLSTAKFVSTAASGASSGSDIAAVSDDGAAIASGDRLGGLLIGGSSDASHNLRSAVGVTGYATELWSGTQNGAKLNFEVTPNGYTSRSVAMTIDQNLNVGIGETSPLPIWGSGRVLCIKDVVNDEVEINFKTTTHSAMMSLGESVSGSYFTIGTDTLADFRISTNTTNRFAISSTGESAFNLANPSEATLQVNTHSDSKIAFLVTGSATASQDVFEVRVGTSKELAVKSSGVLYYNQTPVESQATDSTHKVEVDLGGSTYYFLVTNV